MEASSAALAFGALSQDSRLEVFRQLARHAPGGGLAAGELARQLGIPSSTLSFHLQHLTRAGLVSSVREGRSIIYAIDVEAVRGLFFFLGEDCCQGRIELCASPTARIDARVDEAESLDAAAIDKPNVLFLCSRNSARSQMAEAVLRRSAGERFEVHSGGLRPSAVHPMTIEVLREAGYDTSDLVSKDLGDFLGKLPIHYAIVVCEAADADCPRVHRFARTRLSWPFPDPAAAAGTDAQKLDVFRDVLASIEDRISHWLAGVDEAEESGGDDATSDGRREAL